MRTTWMRRFETIGSLLRKTGPYVALELLLPGGTLFVLALFLYQRRETLGSSAQTLLRRLSDGASALLAAPAPVRASLRELCRGWGAF